MKSLKGNFSFDTKAIPIAMVLHLLHEMIITARCNIDWKFFGKYYPV